MRGLKVSVQREEVAPQALPWFVSAIALGLGGFDILRAVVHTVLVGSVGVEKSGIDISGPTGLDQLMLMVAFGHSNFVTGAALIYLGLRDRFGAFLLMAFIPVTLLIAGASLEHWGSDLVGQGAFPGRKNMSVYLVICVTTVVAATILHLRRRFRNRHYKPPIEPAQIGSR